MHIIAVEKWRLYDVCTSGIRQPYKCKFKKILVMAERKGFEPLIRMLVYPFLSVRFQPNGLFISPYFNNFLYANITAKTIIKAAIPCSPRALSKFIKFAVT